VKANVTDSPHKILQRNIALALGVKCPENVPYVRLLILLTESLFHQTLELRESYRKFNAIVVIFRGGCTLWQRNPLF
jgi:hypothetical protein